jgi:DNA-binding transcriptional MerR regulator
MTMESIEANGGNGHFDSTIPSKSHFRIGEASRLTSTKPFVLRYWETEFPMLQPEKTPKGHRLYRREDIETVFTIKRLLYEEGFTIAGARRHLRDQAAGANGTDGSTEANGAFESPAANVARNNDGSATAKPGEPNHQRAPHSGSGEIAMLNRQTLLDLRDSLRSMLTLLESE